MKQTRMMALQVICCILLLACHGSDRGSMNHFVILDGSGRILSWVQPQDRAYDSVIRRASAYLLDGVPTAANGLKFYYTYSSMNEDGTQGLEWPHNPAGLNAMMVDSALAYYAYSGDRRLPDLVQGLLDYQLAHGTTPTSYFWGNVPYSSSGPGNLEYRGAAPGDAPGVIEVDKIGELGLGYLKWYLFTGKTTYRDAAIHCADALAAHIRPGDVDHSPWPFRVVAQDGRILEEYSSAVIASIRLFDELARLNLGSAATYQSARGLAWAWLMTYPMQNNQWSGYFEDIEIQSTHSNFNQYSPMETARYLLEHPESDSEWAMHVPGLIQWVEKTLIFQNVKNEPGLQWGAEVVSEQLADMNRMGSHTARFASINALWSERSGDFAAREKAFYSFNWATYMCRYNGVVNTGPKDSHVWFTDGYADYIRHFLAGMGAVPEWAPTGETHLLRSSSIVAEVAYQSSEVDYRTVEGDGREVVRLGFAPTEVWADGVQVPPQAGSGSTNWAFDPPTRVLRINRVGAQNIRIVGLP